MNVFTTQILHCKFTNIALKKLFHEKDCILITSQVICMPFRLKHESRRFKKSIYCNYVFFLINVTYKYEYFYYFLQRHRVKTLIKKLRDDTIVRIIQRSNLSRKKDDEFKDD